MDNVVPAHIEISFNLRFSNDWSAGTLKERILAVLNRHELRHDCDWRIAGEPFLAKQGKLLDAVLSAGREVTGHQAVLSTSGGTSDGRFIAPGGTEIVELGPVNASIHKVNERIAESNMTVFKAYNAPKLSRRLAVAKRGQDGRLKRLVGRHGSPAYAADEIQPCGQMTTASCENPRRWHEGRN